MDGEVRAAPAVGDLLGDPALHLVARELRAPALKQLDVLAAVRHAERTVEDRIEAVPLGTARARRCQQLEVEAGNAAREPVAAHALVARAREDQRLPVADDEPAGGPRTTPPL